MELDPKTLSWLCGGGWAVMLILIRRWFAKLDTRLDRFDERLDTQDVRHYICREEFNAKFAPKEETAFSLASLTKRLEELAIKLATYPIVNLKP